MTAHKAKEKAMAVRRTYGKHTGACMKKSFFAMALLAAALALCASCAEKNPLTGKKSLALVDEEALFAESFAAYNDFLKESVLLDDTPGGRAVRETGEKLRLAAEAWYGELGEDGACGGAGA